VRTPKAIETERSIVECPRCGNIARGNGWRKTQKRRKRRYRCYQCQRNGLQYTFYDEAERLELLKTKIRMGLKREELERRYEHWFDEEEGENS